MVVGDVSSSRFTVQESPYKGPICESKREPIGFGPSPYTFLASIRYFINAIFNGFFSLGNPGISETLKNREVTKKESDLKVVFLGDIMTYDSGGTPVLDDKMKALLKGADVIVANLETTVRDTDEVVKRKKGINLEMGRSNLEAIIKLANEENDNPPKWVFSIANNHPFDYSSGPGDDARIKETVASIKKIKPDAEIIGADINGPEKTRVKPILTLLVKGKKIGILAWTDVMNRDSTHCNRPVVRGSDLTDEKIKAIRKEHDYLIGFGHGNEEQSYYPVKETRDRWMEMMGEGMFDMIVGHGPHVLQPAELVGDKPLFHSIGNFCSPFGKSQTRVGAVPEIHLGVDEEKVSLKGYKTHVLEQRGEEIHSVEDPGTSSYPSIMKRLERIWGNLFSSKTQEN